MRYTLLRVGDAGVVLGDYHRRRLGIDGVASDAWSRFVATAAPGVWGVRTIDGSADLRAEPRGESRLADGMPFRLAPSPALACGPRLPKPPSPGLYDAVRAPGVASLLTSGDGREIYEACSAAVVAWDGARLVCVPADRPRVWSTAEAAIRDHLPFVEAPLPVGSRRPVLLVNAVKGCCSIDDPRRETFPPAVRARIERLFGSLISR